VESVAIERLIARAAVPFVLAIAALACQPPKAAESLSVEPKTGSIELGSYFQLGAQATGPVLWSVVEAGGGRVDMTGLYRAPTSMPAAPVVHVAASLASAPQVNDTATLTLIPTSLRAIQVTPDEVTLEPRATRQVTATGLYQDGTLADLTKVVTWSAGNSSAVATVSNAVGAKGIVTGVAPGTTTLTATLAGISGTTQVTVPNSTLISIAVNPTQPSLPRGAQLTLSAIGTFSDGSAQDVSASAQWSSTDSTVVGLSAGSSDETATGVGVGGATVTATLGGLNGSTLVTVTPATVQTVRVQPADAGIAVGASQQFSATAIYSDGSQFDVTAQAAWTTSDTTVAPLSSSTPGLAYGNVSGQATVTATWSGFSGNANVTVADVTLESIAVTPADPTMVPDVALQLFATGTYSDSSTADLTTQVNWFSSDGNVADVFNFLGYEGVVAANNPGAASISASFSGIVGSTVVTVDNAILLSIAIQPNPVMVTLGSIQQLDAMGTYSDNSVWDITGLATWGSSDNTVASVSNDANSPGLLSAVNVGTCQASASWSGVNQLVGVTVDAGP
jgi:trimeric autotransporter adhesin